MEHMVGPVVFPGPLHGNDILGIGHHTDHAAISFLTGADGAQPLSFREVLTDGAEGNGPLGLQNRLSKLLHLILGQRQDKKRQALGSLMANADATAILEVKWDAFLPDVIRDAVQIPRRRAEAFSKYAVCRMYD